MTDSVAVFPPGYRCTDNATGAPIPGAVHYFYDAFTTNPMTVYGTKDLDQASNPVVLGTYIVCDALGAPTSDGSAKTDVFVGTAPYKIVIEDGSGTAGVPGTGVVIETKDNRPGAPVSASSVDVAVTALFPVVTKSLAYGVLAADQNTTFAVNCSSGDVTLTLPSAVTVGDGWKIKVQHAGSANQALLVVASASGQVISEGSKSFGGGYALALNGEDIELTSDGGNWRVSSHTSPFIKLAQGVIPITSRVATSPGSPVQGALYLLTGIGGSFSTFAINDIVQYTGVGYVNFTPYTDCGWLAYVADEDKNYQLQGSAWVALTASDTLAGLIEIAIQSEMETATDVVRAVVPGRQHFHPSAAKCWGMATVATGVPSLTLSYNMTSVTDTAKGVIGCAIATDFSSANYCMLPGHVVGAAQYTIAVSVGQSAGSFGMSCFDTSNNANDPGVWNWAGFGDQ